MDKQEATLTLAEKLRKNNDPKIVINSEYKKKLVRESLACYQVGEPIALQSYSIKDSKQKHSNLHERVEPKANYFLVENFEAEKRIIASSFAIIGEEEIRQVKDSFYKNIPNDVKTAMNVLGIRNYTETYKKYFDGELNNVLLGGYNLFLKLKKSLSELSFDERYHYPVQDFEEYLGISRKDIDKQLKESGLNTKVYSRDMFINKSRIENTINTILGRDKDKHFGLLPDFFDLVFTMPYEDQNVETNKTILRLSCETLDHVKILVDEYSGGKNFSEYFECLTGEEQKEVVSVLEFSKADNPVYNPFLWSKGFRTIGLDYLKIYKESAEGFIKYFSSQSVEHKKAIIKDIMSIDFVNNDVANWLNEHELDLIREVGFNG